MRLRSIMPWAALAILAGCADGRSPSELMSDAAADVGAIRFERAMVRYDSARTLTPDDTEAHLPYATLATYFMLFPEAVAAWERVLELDPGDAGAWDSYIFTLSGAGVFETDRRYTEKLLQVLPEALRSASRRPDIYDHARLAAQALGSLETYGGILAERLAASPDDEVVRHQIGSLRIALADLEGGDRSEAVRDSIATALDELASRHEADAGGDAEPEAPILYRLAAGYDMLGSQAEAERWLERLESAPDRGALADGLRYWRLLIEVQNRLGSSDEGAPEAALELVERGMERPSLAYRGAWVTLRSQAVLRRALASLPGDAPTPRTVTRMVTVASEPPGPALDAPVAEQLFDAAMDVLVWRFAWESGGHLEALRSLLYFGVEPRAVLEEAVRLEEALRADRPGYLFAGYRGDERERARQLEIDRARVLQARALTQLGEIEAAGELLQALATRSRRTSTLGEYGRHLLRADRPQEALTAFVDAIAFGGSALRSLAEEAAAATGLSPDAIAGTIDQQLAVRRPVVEEERVRRELGARLELEAPDFAIQDQNGVEWRLTDLTGKIVVLKFWATWCGPCLAEFPQFTELLGKYEGDDEVVFLTVATAGSPRDEVARMIEDNGYAFPVLFDEQGLALDFNIQGYPTTLYLDGAGTIQYKRQGFSPAGYESGVARRIDALRGEVEGDG
ncbi:redoxin domain-containing protein [Candidatus Palauibacter sp.]|uniref:redoxin domain-containing protein n=1 Tax=Candidatus Palauibacter sp. TaxID=3101350 RepID=UPI003D151A3D